MSSAASNPATSATPSAAPAEPAKKAPRLVSMDAYRGLVMVLMAAEALGFAAILRGVGDSYDIAHYPDLSPARAIAKGMSGSHETNPTFHDWQTKPWVAFWQLLGHNQSHIRWQGCTLHDLIQPSFSFLVGAALLYSLASRVAKGQSRGQIVGHAIRRSFILIALGIAIPLLHRRFVLSFENTLTQIGLGYTFLVLLGLGPKRNWWIAFFGIVIAYFLFFALYPLPGADFDMKGMKAINYFPPDTFMAHWNKNTNVAYLFDHWMFTSLHLPLPAVKDGYCTLNFIPTLATMILGLIASDVLKSSRKQWSKVGWFVAAGVIGLAVGMTLNALGICPYVKKIWTPAWVFFSGGWCFLFLAAFYAVIDIWGYKAWAYILILFGMNSIMAYYLSSVCDDLDEPLNRFANNVFFSGNANIYSHLIAGAIILTGLTLILWAMHKKKIYLKI